MSLARRGSARTPAFLPLIPFAALLLLLLAPLGPVAAQDDPAGTGLLRMPTVSAEHVVFVYANDLWVVDRAGGEARRLPSSPMTETTPRLSPDGSWVAFTGQYDGNTDVYVVPTRGGEPVRLTFHPGADQIQGWTPDGQEVLFVSGREGYPTANTKLFAVPVDGGFPRALPVPRAVTGRMSEDGRHLAYTIPQYWDPEWRNYRGGQALPIWVVSLDDLSLRKTPWEGERHMHPAWLDGILYYLSEADWMMNVWSWDPDTGETRQHTFHDDFDVKHLDAGGGALVYEQAGRLHMLEPGTDAAGSQPARALVVHARGDQPHNRPRWVDISAGQLQSPSISPTGQRAAFEVRGQIVTVPAEHGDLRNLSEGVADREGRSVSGAAHRFPAWSPDGRHLAFFSDAGGEYELVIVPQGGVGTGAVAGAGADPAPGTARVERHPMPEPSFYFNPVWSPDGARIAFRDAGMNLWILERNTGRTVKVDTERHAYPERSLDPAWSPDSRWLAYARRLDSHLRAIWVHDATSGETHQLTDGLSDAIRPQWDASGKYLWFLASTDYGLNTGWLDMSSYERPVTRGVYLAVLAADLPSPLSPRSSEEPLRAGDSRDAEDAGDAGDARGSAGNEGAAPRGAAGNRADPPTVRIDLEGMDQRILALPMPVRNYVQLAAGPEGTVFVGEQVPNEQGLTLHRWQTSEREASSFLTGVASMEASHDRRKLLVRAGNQWRIVNTTGPAPQGNTGALTLSGARIRVDPAEEWAQIFREGWRIQRDFLYVDNFHGAPWDEAWDWYAPWLEHVRHRSDLNYLLDMMGAEIGVGHSYVSGGDLPQNPGVPVGLLGADWEVVDGHYRLARIYRGENWNPGLQSPLAGPGVDAQEGEFLVAINGRPLTAASNLYHAFEATAGQQTLIHLNDRPTVEGARSLTVVPVANDNQLRMREWLEDNRRRVDELSGGRLAYVHIPNTGQGGYSYFNRYFFAQQDRQGVILDQRNNGGGSAADYIADVLSRELEGYFNSPVGDRKPWTQPMAGIFGPKVMIINEQAGSGGDLLPFLFRQRELGTLVGTRTWGGLVGTWDTPAFVDGGRMIAPRGGFINRDGEWDVEGVGVAPDLEVHQTPRDVMEGRDPQLEAAVAEALRLLELNPVEFLPEPAPPLLWRRPGVPPGGG
ncbi:S41 family peptidase [soil metagenome]